MSINFKLSFRKLINIVYDIYTVPYKYTHIIN